MYIGIADTIENRINKNSCDQSKKKFKKKINKGSSSVLSAVL